MRIAGRELQQGGAPFVIAELSGNHAQSLETAKTMIRAAAEAGVDAIKLQTYTPETITLNSNNEEFQINEASSLWRGENLYSLYGKAYTPWEWHKELFELAHSLGLIAFSSPFDESSVDFLENLSVPCYKIASFELNHYPLLKKVAQTGKPVIMSLGMSTLDEIEEAVDYLVQHGCKELALLKCTSAYPAPVAEANLNTITFLQNHFNCPIGLSDHSQGIGVSIAAAALGASIIERHFVLDKNSTAVDAAFSSSPEEFAILVKETRQLSQALGSVHFGPSKAEQDSLKYRRSIYYRADCMAGTMISSEHVKVIRPGFGLAPKFYESIIGKTLKHDIQANTPVRMDDFN